MVIVSALEVEIAPILRALKARKAVQYGKRTALFSAGDHDLLVCGVGPRPAEQTLRSYLKDHRPDHILNIGTAGILAPGIGLREVFGIRQCAGDRGSAPLELVPWGAFPSAVCVSVGRPLNDEGEREALRLRTGAQLVDMECMTLAEIAGECRLGMSALKVTSDHADSRTREVFMEHLDRTADLLSRAVLDLL